MRKVLALSRYLLIGVVTPMASSLAHSPVCSCHDNGNGTVTCEGGFTDGSSAAGVAIRIIDARDRVLVSGKMSGDSTYTFDRPGDEFHVIFDAGQNHMVTVFSGDID